MVLIPPLKSPTLSVVNDLMKTPIKTAWAVPVAILCALLVAGGAVFGMIQAGWPIFAEKKVVETPPPPPEPVRSQWKVSPAAVTLRKALTEPPKGWDARGNVLESPQAPSPFSCGAEGMNPVLSFAQNYQANKGAIQVMLSAYTAGMAKEGLADKLSGSAKCGGGSRYTTQSANGLLEGQRINVTTSGQRTSTIVFRHGDVVVYVIGDQSNGRIAESALQFRDHLASAMNDVCVNPEYNGQEGKRTLFGSVAYEGYTVADKVKTPEVPMPEVPQGANYQAVEIGKKLPKLSNLTLPRKPTSYPVWPELPAPVEKPVEPEVPSQRAPTEKSWGRLTQDTQGPGCGWAFTGTTAPEYNEAEAKQKNSEAEARASAELEAEARAWQQTVLDYWQNVKAFETAAPQWEAYVQNVNTVKVAWDEIGRNWDIYWGLKEEWDREVAARKSFLARQESARESYNSKIAQCEAWEAGRDEREAKYDRDLRDYEKALEAWERRRAQISATPTPAPSPSPSGSDTASPTPTPSPTPSIGPRPTPPVMPSGPVCPPERPSILDQEAPEVGPEPDTPPDPRPVTERD